MKEIDYNLVSTFPDDIFPPPEHLQEEYTSLVEKGLSACSNRSVILCGICRDVANVIELNLIRLYRIASAFKDYKIIIYENDSKDTTRLILEEYAKANDKFHFITGKMDDSEYKDLVDNGKDTDHFFRATAIANCRNEYLKYIKNLEDIDNFDTVMVFDLDLRGGWSYEGIAHSFQMLEELDPNIGCISANGKLSDYYNERDLEDVDPKNHLFFDSWAFRMLNEEEPVNVQRFNGINLSRMDDLVEVNSNFSGLAIYKKEAILPCIYGSKKWSDGVVDCDHPFLHRQMRNNGWKIIINPSMLSSYSHHKFSRILGEFRRSHD